MCTSFYFPDSGLYLLDGFDFYFDLYLNGVTLKISNKQGEAPPERPPPRVPFSRH